MKSTNKLEKLAEYVLNLLEANEEWNADILDEVADYAMELKLAKLNENGMFERKPIIPTK
jgi:hypothetical protein